MKTLLWIDDDEKLIDASLSVFRENGFTVLKATNTSRALSILRENIVDGVLLDVHLSAGENGLELLEAILHLYPTLRIVVFTGYPEYDDHIYAEHIGASAYLSKMQKSIPLDPDKQERFFRSLDHLFSSAQKQKTAINLSDMPLSPIVNQVSGGVDSSAGRDTNVGGDLVGRDKVTSKVTNITNNYLGTAATPNHLELDRQLFRKIHEILPSQSMIDVRQHHYGAAFPRDMHKDLHNFVYFCETPECEFIDAEMERLRIILFECIDQFLRKIGLYTFPEKVDPTWNRIPREPYDPDTYERLAMKAEDEEDLNRLMEEQIARVNRYERELNESAAQSWKAFEEFIRQGRRRLAA